MTNNNKQIKDLINEGLSIISLMKIKSDSLAGSNTNKLKETIKRLFPLISHDCPMISDILRNAENRLVENRMINAFSFGDIRTSLKVLKDNYCRPPKIFKKSNLRVRLLVEKRYGICNIFKFSIL